MTLLTGNLDFVQGSGYRALGNSPQLPAPIPQPRTFCNGMTLVELLVVLGIIGLIVGISVPALTSYAKQVRLKTTTRQIVGLISFARSLAISSHEDHAVVVDPERQEIRLINLVSGAPLEPMVRVPTSVTLEVQVGGQPSQETRLVFRPSGSLAGRTTSLILADQHKHQTITVTGATGAVSVE